MSLESVKILTFQNILDIAIQKYGSIEAMFDLAVANNIHITQDLIPGSALELPSIEYKAEYANYFKFRKIEPATANTFTLLDDEPECSEAEFTEEFNFEFNTCLDPEDDGFFTSEYTNEFLT